MKKLRVIISAWILLSVLFGGVGETCAALRSTADALRIADEFITTTSLPRLSRSSSISQSQIVAENATFFAVNTTKGFVLIGADDRLPEVLGYSDSGTFDPNNLPPAFRYWIQCYEEELSQISNDQLQITNAKALTAISPLLSSLWSQGDPYNKYAPPYNDAGSKCVTGCVATAMAQIMYYYKYPTKGTGSHSYYWICTEPVGKSGTLSANFGATTYDWANMLNSYRSSYNETQADAVATLMYHCGVSIDMGYGESSGAFTTDVPVSLNTYFGYDANFQRVQKVMYPIDSLNKIIYSELKANRPVLVSGSNSEGGHAFVCDGCDTRAYFHINWGWAGSCDGYFLLSALNPRGTQGIGGTTQGYNSGTAFYIGIQPAKTGTPKPIPQMACDSLHVTISGTSRTAKFSTSIYTLENFGMTNFSGSYGIALYDEDETRLVSILKQVDNYSLPAGYHRTTPANLTDLSIPSTVPSGTYHLCAVYKDANYGWMKLLCTKDDYYRTLTLTSSTLTFYPNNAPPELVLTAPISFPSGINADSIPYTGIPVSFSVKNTGGTFRGDISARIYKGNFSKGQYELMDSVVVRRNQTLASALQQAFDSTLLLETQYTMRLCYRANARDSWHNFTPTNYAELPFMLYDPNYHIALTDTIRFDRNDSVPRNNANLYYSIKNTGAPFDGELQLFFYQKSFLRGKSELRTIHVATNETLSDAFSGPLEQTPGTYTVVLRYREINGEWKDFLNAYGANIGSVEATVVPEPPLTIAYSDSICAGVDYTGYGFTISISNLPQPGTGKDFVRTNPDEQGRDSIITLSLKVIANDTVRFTKEVLNSELPYKVDDYFIVPTGSTIGVPFDTLVFKENCSYNSYHITVVQCTISVAYSDSICEGADGYHSYGFNIPATNLPQPGSSKKYMSQVHTTNDCDSTTTLTLAVIANDTVNITPVELKTSQLPYVIDAFYTIPDGTPVGSYEKIVKNDDECSYNHYFITVSDESTSMDQFINDKSQIINHKYIINGALYIIHDGIIYNAQGIMIRRLLPI